MSKGNKESKISQYVREICKGKTDEELSEAEQNFQDYLLVVKEICDRLEQEDKAPDFDEDYQK